VKRIHWDGIVDLGQRGGLAGGQVLFVDREVVVEVEALPRDENVLNLVVDEISNGMSPFYHYRRQDE
jgi:hypothetical protein